MPAKKKPKKLTNVQKKANKEIRESLREKGILHPVKPKLNRAKFAKEVIEEFESSFRKHIDDFYMYEAIGCMLPHLKLYKKVTPEQIGVLKVLKLATEIKKFAQAKKEQGETSYTVGELYDKVIKPIMDL